MTVAKMVRPGRKGQMVLPKEVLRGTMGPKWRRSKGAWKGSDLPNTAGLVLTPPS